MINIVWIVMKNYRNFIGHIKFQIANTMCCVSLFTCIIAVMCNFSIIYTFRELFVKGNIFFPFQINYIFLRVLLNLHKKFSYIIFCDIKYVCFLCDQIPKLLILNNHKECAHLFLLVKNFLNFCISTYFFN